jgi:hypothetical protein
MTKQQAADAFRRLVAHYGLQWTATVPRAAYDEMAEINKVLSAAEKRAALGLPN